MAEDLESLAMDVIRNGADADDGDDDAQEALPPEGADAGDAPARENDGDGDGDGDGATDGDTPAVEARTVTDEDLIEHEGKKIKVSELREQLEKGTLRQADYTKKTQELADERRALSERYDALEAEHASLRETLVDFHRAMQQPREAYLELLEQYPDTLEAIIEHERSIWKREQQMQPDERYDARSQRDRAIRAALDERREKASRAERDRKEEMQRSERSREQFARWGSEAIEAAGEDPKDIELHKALAANAMRRGSPEKLTKDDFVAALDEVLAFGKSRAARDLSKLEADQIEAALGEERMRELGLRRAEKVRGAGAPRGSGPAVTGGSRSGSNGVKRKPERGSAGDFFDSIRDSYGT